MSIMTEGHYYRSYKIKIVWHYKQFYANNFVKTTNSLEDTNSLKLTKTLQNQNTAIWPKEFEFVIE